MSASDWQRAFERAEFNYHGHHVHAEPQTPKRGAYGGRGAGFVIGPIDRVLISIDGGEAIATDVRTVRGMTDDAVIASIRLWLDQQRANDAAFLPE